MPKCPSCGATIDVTLVKSLSGDDIQRLLKSIDRSRLDGDSAKFVDDLHSRLERYGDRTKVTQPQRSWLSDLAKKYPAKPPEDIDFDVDSIPF